MPGSMSGEEKRSDGLLGERSNERRRAYLAPPVLHAAALLLDSTAWAGGEDPTWPQATKVRMVAAASAEIRGVRRNLTMWRLQSSVPDVERVTGM